LSVSQAASGTPTISHAMPMNRLGPTLERLRKSLGAAMSSAIHAGPEPVASTAMPWTRNIATKGSRQEGFCHSSQAATGSISGRGMSRVSARKQKMPTALPRIAHAAARKTKTSTFPVSTSYQNGHETRVTPTRVQPGSASAAAKWRMRHAVWPTIATTANT
jgi:hypothetical protein